MVEWLKLEGDEDLLPTIIDPPALST